MKLHLLACNFERGSGDGVWQSGSSCAIQEVKGVFVNLQSYYYNYNESKILITALVGVAQWTDCWSANQKVADSIPSQGTGLGCRPGLQWGVLKRQPHTDVSLSLFLPPFPSL